MSHNGIQEGRNVKYLPANTTTYNITPEDDFIFVDTSLNAVTLYLPNIKGSGLDFSPKKFGINDSTGNAGTNNITILPTGGDTLNSGNTVQITNNSGSADSHIVSPSEWLVGTDASVNLTGYVPYTGATANVDLGSFGLTTYNLVVGTQQGGYVTGGQHKSQIVADNVNQTPLVIIGGNAAMQFWNDTTPTAAISYGMAVPAGTITNDFILATYNGTWTQRMSIASATGNVNIGNAAANPAPTMGILRIGQNNGIVDIGSLATGYSTIWLGQATPSTTNYSILMTGSTALTLQASSSVAMSANGGSGLVQLTSGGLFSVVTQAQVAGAVTNFTFTSATNTNQTLSTNIPNFKVTGSTKQWATGALATQYFNYFSANTVSFVGASTAAEVYGAYIEGSTAGTNATITNNFALGLLTGTSTIKMGNLTGSTTDAAIYFNQSTPSSSNYSLWQSGATFIVNGNTNTLIRAVNNTKISLSAGTSVFTQNVADTSATTAYSFTTPSNTNQTASTGINGVTWTLGGRQWATGAITTQKEFELTSPTYSFVGASTITDAYSFYVNAPTAGTNATITNSWGIGTSGNIHAVGQYLVLGTASPNLGTNYALRAVSGNTYLNTLGVITDNLQLQVAGTTRMNIFGATATNPRFSFVPANTTSATASTEINGYLYNSYSRQWATGNITTQRESYFKTVTYTAVGASVITNAYGMYAEKATASTNITITNNYGIGTDGYYYSAQGLVVGSASPLSYYPINIEGTNTIAYGFQAKNLSNGTGTGCYMTLLNDGGSYISALITSSGYTTSGLTAANQAYLYASRPLFISGDGGIVKITGDRSNTSSLMATFTSTGNASNTFSFSAFPIAAATATSEVSGWVYNSITRTWAAGAITTQREQYIKTVTYAFASASTITTAYGFYVEAPTAGTNATITNRYAAGFNGNIQILTGGSGAGMKTGEYSANLSTIWLTQSSPSGANYAIAGIDGANTLINGATTVNIRIGGSDAFNVTSTLITFKDAIDFVFNGTTGTKFGTSTSGKFAFWNATPIVQPTTAVAAATLVSNGGTTITSTDTFDGYTLQQFMRAVRSTGLLA